MIRVLHITAHLGAGAGKAISGIVLSDKTNEYRIVLLQKPEKKFFVEECRKNGIEIIECPKSKELKEQLEWADVVVINWWHHPLTYPVFMMIDNMKTRCILWSHVNGLNYPVLGYNFTREFDKCMFTTPLSYDNRLWSDLQKEDIESNSSLIYGTGNFHIEEYTAKSDYRIRKKVKIGYCGSLDYAKIHPDIVSWIEDAISTDRNLEFVFAGDVKNEIKRDISDSEISDNVRFLGYCDDIPALLNSFDIFIYPLNPRNFATTENALLEAMATGLPIITGASEVERSIIIDGKTGLTTGDAESFCGALYKMISDEALRTRLGKAAKEYVCDVFDSRKNVLNYKNVLNDVMTLEKRRHNFKKFVGTTPYEWFLSACDEKTRDLFLDFFSENKSTEELNNDIKDFVNSNRIFSGRSKGSVIQYSDLFPEDIKLQKLRRLIEQVKR